MPTFEEDCRLNDWQGPSEATAVGTKDLLWSQRVSDGRSAPNGSLSSEVKNPLQSKEVAWSATISPGGSAILFDGPGGTGTVWGQAALSPSDTWHFRLVVNDGTSAGFAASDGELNLYSVRSDLAPAITVQPRSQIGCIGGERSSGYAHRAFSR